MSTINKGTEVTPVPRDTASEAIEAYAPSSSDRAGQVAVQRPLSIQESLGYAKMFIASGLFKDVKSLYQAGVKIIAGTELGFPPFASMNMIDIVEGKCEVKPIGMRALIRRDGKYDYEVNELTNEVASVSFFRIVPGGKELLGTSVFTQKDAKQADLTEKGGVYNMYKKYPRNMLINRATSNGVRWFCPDIAATVLYATGEISKDEYAEIQAVEVEERADKRGLAELYDKAAMFMSGDQKSDYETMYWHDNITDLELAEYLTQFIPQPAEETTDEHRHGQNTGAAGNHRDAPTGAVGIREPDREGEEGP